MRLKAFRKIGDPEPIIADVSVVIVEDDNGVPVAVACEVGPGAICTAHARDEEFNRILKTLGIDRLVITDNLESVLKNPEQLPLLVGGQ